MNATLTLTFSLLEKPMKNIKCYISTVCNQMQCFIDGKMKTQKTLKIGSYV